MNHFHSFAIIVNTKSHKHDNHPKKIQCTLRILLASSFAFLFLNCFHSWQKQSLYIGGVCFLLELLPGVGLLEPVSEPCVEEVG